MASEIVQLSDREGESQSLGSKIMWPTAKNLWTRETSLVLIFFFYRGENWLRGRCIFFFFFLFNVARTHVGGLAKGHVIAKSVLLYCQLYPTPRIGRWVIKVMEKFSSVGDLISRQNRRSPSCTHFCRKFSTCTEWKNCSCCHLYNICCHLCCHMTEESGPVLLFYPKSDRNQMGEISCGRDKD